MLSFLLINMHAAMWYFQFVFLLPFILNGIKFDKIKLLKKLKIDNYKLKPILIAMVCMIIIALVNPYGIQALLYIFKSYGIPLINEIIGEMNSVTWTEYQGKVIFIYIILFMLLCFVRRDLKFDIRHFLFMCGLTLLGFMHNKCYPLFVLVFTYTLMYYFKKMKIDIKPNNKILFSLGRGLSVGLALSLLVTFVLTIYNSYTFYTFEEKYKMDKTISYILDNYNKEEVVLYINFNTGGYAEYRGLKAYIDGRAELFFKKFNEKEDIFKEAFSIEREVNFDFDSFINKYNFTHIIVYDFSYFKMYLDKDDKYELVFSDVISKEDNISLMLYAKKDLEVLE